MINSGYGKRFIHYFFIIVLLVFSTFVIIRNAWLSDDAYITFRTVDNFVNGYGLTWNVNERVQAYTNPLWMFLISAFYFFTHEIFFTSIYISIVVSVATLLLFAVKIAKTWYSAITGIVILCLSKAFIDYTTSGLENPLLFLITALFFIVYLRGKFTIKTLFFLSLFASLGAFTRMDTILIFAPCLVHAYTETRKWIKGIMAGVAGFLPFFLWTGFSLFYYGFPFPNTAYAKLNTGISDLDLALQGINYFQNSVVMDPLCLIVIGVSIFSFCFTKKKRSIASSAGILLYLLYIVKIGGDFMSGRFFALPVFCAVINICAVPPDISRIICVPALCFSLFTGLQSPYAPVFSDKDYINLTISHNGIADERGFYYPCSGYLPGLKRKNMPFCEWAREGRKLKKEGPRVIVHKNVGNAGFFAGPAVHFIDLNALTEPLLSKINVRNPHSFRIGHFARNLPRGYLQTIETGKNVIVNKRLATYYDKLSYIIKGDLFEWNRIKEIILMNMGQYDYLLSQYRNTLIRVHENQLRDFRQGNTSWDSIKNYLFTEKGIHISMNKSCHAPRIEVTIRYCPVYRISYFMSFFETGVQEITPLKTAGNRLVSHTINIPPGVAKAGYTGLRIIPVHSKGIFSIGYMRVLKTDTIKITRE
ncbi:MAG: hypothetical protein JXB88_17930 [Spirochaetales bacterium]|nr:hypothetical protein [Spirochaetales bacterium]